MITGILRRRGRQERNQSEEEVTTEEWPERGHVAGFEPGEKGLGSNNYGWLLEAGKARHRLSSRGSREECNPTDTLVSAYKIKACVVLRY